MSNAAKHRKKAAEFEQLKQIDRAIAMYIKAIDEGEAEGEDIDVALLNKVGDLTLRQGRVADAVTYYERAVEHYATSGLFNNAIALCNKILRSAPGRSTVYFTLGRICAKKGLRGDATRNFLEYATRMQQDGRIDEGMRALAEVADLMPELTEVRRLVDEHAARVGITIPRRQTPTAASAAVAGGPGARRSDKSSELVFLEIDAPVSTRRNTPPLAPRVSEPLDTVSAKSTRGGATRSTPARGGTADGARSNAAGPASLDAFLLFDPSRPGAVTPPGAQRAVAAEAGKPADASADLPAGATPDTSAIATSPEPTGLPSAHVAEISLDLVADMPVTAPNDPAPVSSTATPSAPLLVSNTETAAESASPDAFASTSHIDSDTMAEAPQPPSEVSDVILDVDVSDSPDVAYSDESQVTSEALSLDAPDTITEMVDPGVEDTLVAATLTDTSASVVETVPGLESMDAGEPVNLAMLDGWSSHRVDELDEALPIGTELRWSTPVDALPAVPEPDGFASHTASLDAALDAVSPLPDLVVEDFDHVADDPNVYVVTGARAGTPAYGTTFPRSLTPIDVSPIPELDAAIEAGALAAARAEADPTLVLRRPPFRIDPHDFILPGELPPLMAEDELGASAVLSDGEADLEPVDATTPMSGRAHDSVDAPLDVLAPEAVAVEPQGPEAEHDAMQSPTEVVAGEAGIEAADQVPDAVAPEAANDGIEWLNVDGPHDGSITPPDGPIFEPIDLDEVEGQSRHATANASEIVAGDVPGEVLDEREVFGEAAGLDDHELFGDREVLDDHQELDTRAEADNEGAADPAITADLGETPPVFSVDASFVVEPSATYEPLVDATPDDEPETAIGHAAEPSPQSVEESAHEAIASNVSSPPSGDTTSSGVVDAIVDAVEASAAAEERPEAEPEAVVEPRGRSGTPSVPIATIAAEAQVAARARYEALQQAVAAAPQDWAQRRRLAEALFEAGMPDRGFAELQAALSGLSQSGQLNGAAEIADELVRISPDRIAYHQKRVELAVRLNDQQRLRIAYLDLADTLVRAGDEARAHAVYARVLELDPWDGRAREALGAAAPPPPPPAAAPEEDFVDLAEWLRDDEPASTRMRMREPVVSGDEQADFDSLLRHFKEGVSRSLGEDDFESHYDLGVAYKEMGLLDDAIAEFQKALRSRRHRLPAYEALGQCFVEQSRHSVAATVLTRALHEPGLGDEHRVGVLYLLAYSCEALQRWDEARSYYSRVYATDIHFRDVAARLAALDLIAR